MKHRRILFVLLAAVLFLFSTTAYAEGDVPEELQAMEEKIHEMVKAIIIGDGLQNVYDVRSFSLADTNCVKLVWVERLAEFDSEDNYLWKIPILETEDKYYLILASREDNITGTMAVKEVLVNEMNNHDYLFDPELVPGILERSGLFVDYDSLTPVCVTGAYTDVFVFSADGFTYAIPFSARPDFLEIENGKIYEFSEMVGIIDGYLDKMDAAWNDSETTGNSGGGFGGGGGAASPTETTAEKTSPTKYALPVAIAAAAVCAGVLFVYRKRRGS